MTLPTRRAVRIESRQPSRMVSTFDLAIERIQARRYAVARGLIAGLRYQGCDIYLRDGKIVRSGLASGRQIETVRTLVDVVKEILSRECVTTPGVATGTAIRAERCAARGPESTASVPAVDAYRGLPGMSLGESQSGVVPEGQGVQAMACRAEISLSNGVASIDRPKRPTDKLARR